MAAVIMIQGHSLAGTMAVAVVVESSRTPLP